MKRFASALLLCIASTSQAQEFVLGLGQDDLFGLTKTQAAATVVEYHSAPFFTGHIASYSWAVAGHADTDGDLWVGAGIHGLWRFGDNPIVIEGSLMPGYYHQGPSGTPLTGNLQFRTLFGIGYELTDQARVSLAIDHKSNADTQPRNPGSETLTLRWTFGY